MASNSDSIYNVLTYIKRHPDRVTFKPLEYGNVVTMGIDDQVPVANQDLYFPVNRLSVNLMTDDFVGEYSSLLDYFFNMTQNTRPGYHEVWITTSHIVDQHLFLVEISFE
ncbi:hypothetical protein GPK34_02430 [Secundilactobacillus kimchicus]|uniref:hypothetical protein n=1 Tax=Secundilactobacillus kimchicus TaxID=528209 RepID=UPI001C00F952|nr:hypothetical protein [Secundilactobacillus kimchicus]